MNAKIQSAEPPAFGGGCRLLVSQSWLATTMGISKGVVELQLAAEDPDLCRDKAVELLKEGNATLSAEWCVYIKIECTALRQRRRALPMINKLLSKGEGRLPVGL